MRDRQSACLADSVVRTRIPVDAGRGLRDSSAHRAHARTARWHDGAHPAPRDSGSGRAGDPATPGGIKARHVLTRAEGF